MSSVALSEPAVLAHTKRRLFPSDDQPGYVVTDTQFGQDEWLSGRTIESAVRDTLAPFNHVRVGSGYPDLVGVGRLGDDLLGIDRIGDDPPLIAVEAKGYTNSGVDVERGIVQAYDRLDEANVAFAAAPAEAIDQSARTMARELNVGVLAVGDDGSVESVVEPRAVGTHTAGDADAIRFQASAQGVVDRNFSLNHPKNYLAYPLALAAEGDTEQLIDEFVVGATDGARNGAVFLNLIDDTTPNPTLTPLGREVVRFGQRVVGSPTAALRQFADWKRSRRRFCDLAPEWGQLARRVVYDYPATELLVEELQRMHADGFREPSVVDLVVWLHRTHPTFAVELFLRGTDDVRQRALSADGDLDRTAICDGDSYHSPTVFQLKTMLYHAGILTENGTEPATLDPERDEWALRESVSDGAESSGQES